jgi:hypothetical protein
MARPGLEPGTPRFSVVGRNLSNSAESPANPAGSRDGPTRAGCRKLRSFLADSGTRMPFSAQWARCGHGIPLLTPPSTRRSQERPKRRDVRAFGDLAHRVHQPMPMSLRPPTRSQMTTPGSTASRTPPPRARRGVNFRPAEGGQFHPAPTQGRKRRVRRQATAFSEMTRGWPHARSRLRSSVLWLSLCPPIP